MRRRECLARVSLARVFPGLIVPSLVLALALANPIASHAGEVRSDFSARLTDEIGRASGVVSDPPETPAPDDSVSSEDGDNGVDPISIAIVSALAGALATLGGERIFETKRERKVLKNLLKTVQDEVEVNVAFAKERAQRQPNDPFPFHPALRMSAWDSFRSSGISWRLAGEAEFYSSVNSFYADVEDANHAAKVASDVFALSQNDGLADRAQQVYISKAMTLSSKPYEPVVESGSALLRDFRQRAK